MLGLHRYCGAHVPTTTASNGAVLAADLHENVTRVFAVEPRLIRVTDRVHTFVGGSIVNRTFIEGDDGVIVYDTGDDLADGRRAVAALREITDKPVKAIVYSHNHYAHGSRAFVDEGDDGDEVLVIGHPRLNANLHGQSGFAGGGEFPEAAPVLHQRFLRQFGTSLPASGPDAGFAAVIPESAAKGTLPANRTVQDGETLTVAGIRMQFFTRHISDSDDTLTVWLPDHGVVLNNFLWSTLPNLYTLRGDIFRDPQSWRDGVRLIRRLQPEHLVNTHALPVSGADTVAEVLDAYADAVSYFVDQTLRGITKGLGPDDLREFVQLPEHLRNAAHNAENYGELSYFPPYIYQHIFGWYDGEPAHINPAPRRLAAQRIVEGFGGRNAVLASVRKAVADGELSWAAELVTHLLTVEPDDEQARAVKAGILRSLAQIAAGTIGRHFYLSHALELEGKISIPAAIPVTVDTVLACEPTRFIDFQRIRLNPDHSRNADVMLAIELTDADTACALHVRRGVAEFVTDLDQHPRSADSRVSMTFETWARLYTGGLDVADGIAEGALTVDGDPARVVAFFGMFDAPRTD